MSRNSEDQYIRLEVISGRNLEVPSDRIPAGIYISFNINSSRRWKSAIRVLSFDKSIAWGDTATLYKSLDASPALSVEIRASFELDRMLGNGEVVGKLQTSSWDALLNHKNKPFDTSSRPFVVSTLPSH
ncbi:hypothetical protein BD769DRAFT_1773521 [Suillus cothurnatus]|nr:hypothetical protein BD769DRAFT_1773521 [Suillus cothurnatus]